MCIVHMRVHKAKPYQIAWYPVRAQLERSEATQANCMEPYAGAVLGKILILVLVILFIQKRPRGLFALKGRAAEE